MFSFSSYNFTLNITYKCGRQLKYRRKILLVIFFFFSFRFFLYFLSRVRDDDHDLYISCIFYNVLSPKKLVVNHKMWTFSHSVSFSQCSSTRASWVGKLKWNPRIFCSDCTIILRKYPLFSLEMFFRMQRRKRGTWTKLKLRSYESTFVYTIRWGIMLFSKLFTWFTRELIKTGLHCFTFLRVRRGFLNAATF